MQMLQIQLPMRIIGLESDKTMVYAKISEDAVHKMIYETFQTLPVADRLSSLERVLGTRSNI